MCMKLSNKINYIWSQKELIKSSNNLTQTQRSNITILYSMGTILSQQNSEHVSQRSQSQILKINRNWKILQNSFQKQIIQSKKTQLILERYWFVIEHHQDMNSQTQIFQWRNKNLNSEVMVNVLSVGKDQIVNKNQNLSCGVMNWCPSQRIVNKVYVVTERILKVGELQEFFIAKKKIEAQKENIKPNALYSTDQTKEFSISQKMMKFKPFLSMTFSLYEFAQIVKDWLRGIEVLCYKFGYFKINPELLGITVRMRGNVWISSNYANNYLSDNQKIQVSTAEQKFKYEKDTIQKILSFIGKIEELKGIIPILSKSSKFDEALKALQRLSIPQITIQNKEINRNHNSSLFVEQGSFSNPNNLSVIKFEHSNFLQRLNQNKKYVPEQRFSLAISSRMNMKNLASSTSNNSVTKKSMKRSNTGQKGPNKKVSPQNKKQTKVFINSGHKYGGRQTAPTNELGHSSSLQSVNHLSYKGNGQNNILPHTLMKSQNYNFASNQVCDEQFFRHLESLDANHKVYYPVHVQRHHFSCEPHIFRSQNNISLDFEHKSPTRIHNKQIPHIHHQKHSPKQNYSLDEINMIGPYRKQRIYSNLKKKQIALVDSMVQVHQQSQQIDQQLINSQRTKIIMEESIIIRGRSDSSSIS